MNRFIYLLLFIILFSFSLQAVEKSILTGKVFSKNTGRPIPGATIRVPNTNYGTYSSSSGFFRLKIPGGTKEIKVSSLGHKSTTKKLGEKTDTIFVYLEETSVGNKGVTVTGDIEPNEVIKRAIERKQDNLSKLKTFKGRLYSKMLVELDGSLFASGQGGGTVFIGMSTDEDSEERDKYRLFLLETFSDMFIDYDKEIRHTEILQRRQTSNLKPDDNIMAIGNFMNFYNDEIRIVNTEIVTPLSEDAFSYYDFEIIDKQSYDEKYVYVIKVIPSTSLYPAFEGTIKLIEGTYNLVEVNLKPSENTAITFLEDLSINQRFTESVEKIWYPSFLEINGKAAVDVLKGILDIKADVTATSIYSDVTINQPLPDSIYKDERKRSLAVSDEADSMKTEFWEDNALREISDEEKEIYSTVDSLVVKDSVRKAAVYSAFNWTWFPYVDFNRVSSVSLGLKLGFSLYNFNLDLTGAYSFGLKEVLWDTELNYRFKIGENSNLTTGMKVFSKAGRISLDRSYSRIVNTVMAGLFHFDYFDFMKSEGFDIYGSFSNPLFALITGVEFSKQSSLPKTTNKSIFSNKKWRENPEITEGEFTTAYLAGRIGDVNYIIPSRTFENELAVTSILGVRKNDNNSFFSVVGKYKTSIPTFKTGYGPMKLFLALEGGKTSEIIPMQYLNRMQSAMLIVNKFGNFLSAPPAEYGGREYYAGHAAFNTSDLWWRFLGLPLFEGRGLNLILAGSYSRFFSQGESIYRDTGNDHYSEIGFGFTRIPTFISNVIFLSFDARWGVGPVASGRFGWALSVSLPF